MHDRLTMSPLPEDLRGLVVMMHGGAERSHRPVDHRNLALRRTQLMTDAISPSLNRAGVATGVLRFVVKGWNDERGNTPSPVVDARLALGDLHQEFPGLPIVLVGHSMGARTAAAVGDQPGVVGIVGLAPWFPADDPVEQLSGKQIVAVHGSRDRITSPKASRIYIERASQVAEDARFVGLDGLGHYMLAGARQWNRAALRESLGVLDRVCPAR